MADSIQMNNQAPQLNQWGTITFEVPDYLAHTREKINDVAQVMIAALDIVLTALEFVKTFLTGYLDPIMALLEAILKEIDALIKDLRQLGVYITSDYKLLKWPFDELEGGYKEFERRMISRLTDLTDPTRPDVSAFTEVLSMFFYLSVDVSHIEKLIIFVDQMLAYFRQSFQRSGSLPVATLAPVLYGTDAASLIQGFHASTLTELFKFSSTPPQIAKLRWTLSSAAQRNPFNPVPPLPPGGFIVTVSTVQDGLKVVFDTPRANATMQPSVNDADKQVQPRDYGQVRVSDTGNPLILFGGAEMIPEKALFTPDGFSLTYNQIYKGGIFEGTSRVYAQLVTGSDAIIPLEQLKQTKDGKTIYLMQRTFYVPSTEKWASWVEGNFSHLLAAEDMPYTCKWVVQSDGTILPEDMEPATTVYVRVVSCSKDAFDKQIQYQFQSPNAKGGSTSLNTQFSHGLGSSALSSWSKPVRVTFPSANTQAYLEAIKVALVVLVLSRPDLPLINVDRLGIEALAALKSGAYKHPEVAAQACGLEGLKQLAGVVYKDYQAKIAEKGVGPTAFRQELLSLVEKAAHNIHNTTGTNPQLEKIVVDQTKYLRSVTWGDIFAKTHASVKLPDYLKKATILQSLDVSEDSGSGENNGLALNPYSIGILENVVQEWFYIPNLFQDRKPQMLQWSVGPNVDPGFTIDLIIPKDKVAKALAHCPPGMVKFYERNRVKNAEDDNDGGITIPETEANIVNALVSRTFIQGSADVSPVFFLKADQLIDYDSATIPKGDLAGGIYYCRGLFAAVNSGQILQEASVALSLAGAAIQKSLQDGQWVNYRFLDMFPGLDDFFTALKNWLEAVQKSLKSIVDTIKKYIQFIESRIVELQQLIRRINAILQELLGFVFQIPQCAALVLVSKGTQGVVGDLVLAKNKPADSPFAYGAGIAVVIPFGPALAMDLVKAIFAASTDNPKDGATMAGTGGITAIGIEGLPSPTPSGDQPPDVL